MDTLHRGIENEFRYPEENFSVRECNLHMYAQLKLNSASLSAKNNQLDFDSPHEEQRVREGVISYPVKCSI